MQLDVDASGPRLGGRRVAGDADVTAVLGTPDRRIAPPRAVPGLEERRSVRLAVWDAAGILAGERLLVVAPGPNVLDEPVWPARAFAGPVYLEGRRLDPAVLPADPLREDRRSVQLGPWRVVVITTWDGAVAKVVVTG